MTIPPYGQNPYVNRDGNPLRKAAARVAVVPQAVAPQQGMRARDVAAVVHHTPSGDVVEYNVAAPAMKAAAAPAAPHGAGVYAIKKR